MIRENNVQKIGSKLMLFICAFFICGCNSKEAVSGDVNSEVESIVETKYDANTQGFDYESSDTGTVELASDMLYDGTSESVANEKCVEKEADKNTILVKNMGKAEVNLSNIEKKGSTNYFEESLYYGLNSAIVAMRKGCIIFKESDITTDGIGASGVFCTGNESNIDIIDATILTKKRDSYGIATTYSGKVQIDNSEITTKLDNSDIFYCAGSISASNLNAISEKSKIATIKGNGNLDIAESELTCNSSKCSFEMFRKKVDEMTRLNIIDSVIKNEVVSESFLNVHDTNGEIFLTNTTIDEKTETFLNITNANLKITTMNQNIAGKIESDEKSSVEIILLDNSCFKGVIEEENKANIVINLDENSTWELTGNSYVSVFGNKNINLSNITTNGYNIYYDANNSSNGWLSKKTIELSDGGKILPLNN